MKKKSAAVGIVLALMLLFSQFAFASGLEITKINPADGARGKQISNMAVKVTFSETMDEADIAANTKKFKITDPEGNDIAFQLVFSAEKYPDQLWVILDQDLVSNTEYTLTVAPGVKSASGSTLETGVTSTFKTRNTMYDSFISFGFMALMMVFMVFTSKQAMKKAEEAQNEVPAVYEEMNPYKLAKEKGISVEEAQKIVAERREKQAKNAAKIEAEKARRDEAMAAEIEAQEKRLREEAEAARHAANYHVKKSGSMVERGCEVPKKIVRANRKKREAAAAAAKKAAKKNK